LLGEETFFIFLPDTNSSRISSVEEKPNYLFSSFSSENCAKDITVRKRGRTVISNDLVKHQLEIVEVNLDHGESGIHCSLV